MFELKPFTRKFSKPIVVGKKVLTKREGFYICKNGEPISECSPLPGLSLESISHCEQYFYLHQSKILAYLNNGFLLNNCPAALAFALDTIKYNLFESKTSINLKLNTLILDWKTMSMSSEDIVKIKLGRKPFEDDLAFIKQLKTNTKIRFDCNRSWHIDEAIIFFENAKHLMIEYVEEPLINSNQLSELYKMTKLPIALDESINLEHNYNLAHQFPVKALVIKPSCLGFIDPILNLVKKKVPYQFVFSSCFETELGIWAIANLANRLNPHGTHGLNTIHYFNSNFEHLFKIDDNHLIGLN